MIRLRIAMLLLGASALAACDLAPHEVRTAADAVPQSWPAGAAYAPAAAGKAGMPWRSLVTDATLRIVIEREIGRASCRERVLYRV